jgi:hypothetical protein
MLPVLKLTNQPKQSPKTNKQMNTQPSTTKKIEAWLSRGYKLTPLQALEKWGCMRLGARIYELRKGGMDIRTMPITRNGKTFAQYQAV